MTWELALSLDLSSFEEEIKRDVFVRSVNRFSMKIPKNC